MTSSIRFAYIWSSSRFWRYISVQRNITTSITRHFINMFYTLFDEIIATFHQFPTHCVYPYCQKKKEIKEENCIHTAKLTITWISSMQSTTKVRRRMLRPQQLSSSCEPRRWDRASSASRKLTHVKLELLVLIGGCDGVCCDDNNHNSIQSTLLSQ